MRLEWEKVLKTIFSGVLIGDIDITHPEINAKRDAFKQCLPLFKGMFAHNIFEDEYAVFYSFIKAMRISVFDSDTLSILLDQNSDIILNSESIDFNAILSTIEGLKEKASDIDKFVVFKSLALERLKELSNNVVTVEEFRSACETYKHLYIDYLTDTMINNMAIIKSHGKRIKNFDGKFRRYNVGLDGVKEYYRDMMNVIDSLKDATSTQHSTLDADWLKKQLDNEDKGDDNRLLDFGLDEIDSVWGWLRRTNMLGVLGPPKGGKTRTTGYLVSRALEKGLNVAVWPLEGDKSEWENMIVANTVKLNTGVQVDTDTIADKKYDDDIRQIVLAAKTDLAIGATRGRLSFIGGSAYVEDFIDVLKYHYENENAYDVIVIDSLVLVGSARSKGKVERISEAYNKFQDFLKNGLPIKPLGIVPAQLKQDVVDYLRAHPGETIDVTAGGESAETIRTPDFVLGVFSTKEERDIGQMKFYSVATRHTNAFKDFYARCALGCCHYESDPELNKSV